jgi:MFS family permease
MLLPILRTLQQLIWILPSGSIVCTPISAIISDKLGRRKCMFIGSLIIIIGSVVITSAMTLPQFVVGRFILGVGIQVMVVSAPAYAVEIAPPHWRGRAVGEYLQLVGKTYYASYQF